MQTGSKELIRGINSALVLESIINSNNISRADLAKQLGLTKATISTIVEELMNKNQVLEVGSDDTKLGRKPILLCFNRNAGHVLCIEIEQDTISALKTNLRGEDRSLKQIRTPAKCDAVVSAISSLIDTMIQDYDKTPYGLVGISVSIHGSVSDNTISSCNNLHRLNIAEALERQFQVPVYLYNDASLSLLGEKVYHYDYSNMVNVYISSDVRLGILIHNKLYTGFNGTAGDVGHTIIAPGGKECSCGNHGCLNQYISESGLFKELAEKKGLPSIDMDTFSSMYKSGDKDTVKLMNSFIKYLSIYINNVAYSYNPESIIITSRLIYAFPSLMEQLEESLKSYLPQHNIAVVPSALGHNSVLVGGISAAIMNFLEIQHLKL